MTPYQILAKTVNDTLKREQRNLASLRKERESLNDTESYDYCDDDAYDTVNDRMRLVNAKIDALQGVVYDAQRNAKA